MRNDLVGRVNDVRILSMCFQTKYKAFAGRQLTQNRDLHKGKTQHNYMAFTFPFCESNKVSLFY